MVKNEGGVPSPEIYRAVTRAAVKASLVPRNPNLQTINNRLFRAMALNEYQPTRLPREGELVEIIHAPTE